jgi:hypothetical protein
MFVKQKANELVKKKLRARKNISVSIFHPLLESSTLRQSLWQKNANKCHKVTVDF